MTSSLLALVTADEKTTSHEEGFPAFVNESWWIEAVFQIWCQESLS